MKLSVLMITYNHEKYIAQALDSVLMQQTDFDFEIVLGEDCSTDNTRSIVLDYQRRYPDKIKVLLSENNMGMTRNFIQTFNACTGEYVALLEGDDYWLSPLKLQKQVNVLDKHYDLSICFHNTNWIDDNSNIIRISNSKQKQMTDIYDIIDGWFIMTASIVFRKKFLINLPEWFMHVGNGDYALQLLLADNGKIFYIDELMSNYRKHACGASSRFHKNKLQIALSYLFYNFDKDTDYKYHEAISKKLLLIYRGWIDGSNLFYLPSVICYSIKYNNISITLISYLFRRVLHL